MSRFLGKSKYISCQGLLGSYEDCLTLLNEEEGQKLLCIRNRHLLFLWLGNSITNMPWEDSVDIVRRMLWSSNSALLVSVDGNQNPQSIQMAYDMPDGKNRRFLRNGLTHANLLLDEGVFNAGDWDLEAKWYAEDKEHRAYHVAKREISLTVDGNIVQIAKGEKIHAITSAKWTTEEVERLCEAAGVELEHSWIEPVYNFGTSELEFASPLLFLTLLRLDVRLIVSWKRLLSTGKLKVLMKPVVEYVVLGTNNSTIQDAGYPFLQ